MVHASFKYFKIYMFDLKFNNCISYTYYNPYNPILTSQEIYIF